MPITAKGLASPTSSSARSACSRRAIPIIRPRFLPTSTPTNPHLYVLPSRADPLSQTDPWGLDPAVYVQEGYDGFSGNGDQFQNLDQYAQFNHHQNQPHTSSFRNPPGPPTPPTHPPLSGQQGHSHLNDIAPRKLPNEPQHGDATKIDADQAARTGSISEDDDMTPAQSRRKAQNRAA